MITTLLTLYGIGFLVILVCGGLIAKNFMVRPLPAEAYLKFGLALIFYPVMIVYYFVKPLINKLFGTEL